MTKDLDDKTLLPRYKCHKEVSALEISTYVEWDDDHLRLHFKEIGYGPIIVDRKLFARYTPKAGDFYVVYDDGFASISPRKAFVEGYTKIESSPRADPKPGETWRHYKGGVYCVLSTGVDDETLEPVVVYQHVPTTDGANATVWVRKRDVFMEKVAKDAYFVNRFERLEG